jgi:shikimate 5-dehydrogenase
MGSPPVDRSLSVLVHGSGGMAKAVVAAFREVGFSDLTVLARNAEAGRALARKYGYRAVTDSPAPGHAVIVNVTPLGMNGADADALSFSRNHVSAAQVVFDVVAFPAETPLIRAARTAGTQAITGAKVIALQAARQFERYTGVAPTEDQVEGRRPSHAPERRRCQARPTPVTASATRRWDHWGVERTQQRALRRESGRVITPPAVLAMISTPG